MAITTYTELVAEVTDWLHRTNLNAKASTFITLAEAKFSRKLRVEDMVTLHETTISAAEIPVPADYLEAISLKVGADPLTFKPRTEFFTLEGNYYTRMGSKWLLAKDITGSADVELHYYARIPALSSENETNWLLTAAPDLYLSGALLEAVPYMKLGADDTRPAQWAGTYADALADITSADENSRYSGQTLTIGSPR